MIEKKKEKKKVLDYHNWYNEQKKNLSTAIALKPKFRKIYKYQQFENAITKQQFFELLLFSIKQLLITVRITIISHLEH